MEINMMNLEDDKYAEIINYNYNNDFYYIDYEKAITQKYNKVDITGDNECELQKAFNTDKIPRGLIRFTKTKYTYTFNNIYPLSREQYVDNFKRYNLKRRECLKLFIKTKKERIIESKAKLEKLNKEIKLIEKKKYKLSKVMIKDCLRKKGSRLTNILKLPLQKSLEIVLKNNLFKDEDEIIECYRELNIDEKNNDINKTKDRLYKLHYTTNKDEKLLKTLKNKKL